MSSGGSEQVTELQALRALVLLRLRVSARRFARGFSNTRRHVAPASRASTGVPGGQAAAYGVALLFLSLFLAYALYLCALAHARWQRVLGEQAVPSMASFHVAVLLLSNLLINLGGKDQDLSKPVSENSWLLTLPIPDSTLYWAKIAHAVPRDVFGWLYIFPFLTTLSWHAGQRVEALGVGVVGCLVLVSLSAAVRLVLEALSHRWLSHAARRLVQYAAVFLGVSGAAAVFAQGQRVAFTDEALVTVYGLARVVLLPGFSDLTRLALHGLTPATAWSFCAVFALLALALLLGKLVFIRSVRSGWWGPTASTSRRGPPNDFSATLGVTAKELRWVTREPAFIKAIAGPLGIYASALTLTWVTRETLSRSALLSAAFLVGFILTGSMTQAWVSSDGPSAWLWWTVPRRYDALILQRVGAAVGIATLATLAFVSVQSTPSALLQPTHLLSMSYAVVGFAASGAVVAASTAPGESTTWSAALRGRLVVVVVAILSLAAIGEPLRWSAVSAMALSATIALAAVLDARERIPFMFDPVAAPSGPIRVMYGAVAASVMLIIQDTVLFVLGRRSDLSSGLSEVLARTAGGTIVVVGAVLMISWRSLDRSELWRGLGLVVPRAARAAARDAFVLGCIASLIAMPFLSGLLHFQLLDQSPLLKLEQRDALRWHALAWLVMAPLSEEFVFRGLLFGALRRHLSGWWAIALSSFVFALVHPPAAAVPLFVMGVLAATVYRRHGSLLAPVILHVTYNAAIVIFWLAYP